MAFKKGSPEEFLTTKDVSNLKYTNKVVEEVIRITNVTPFVFRKAVNEVDYKGTYMVAFIQDKLLIVC
jgi:ent-kaurenoic acid hydroxylase